MMQRGVEEYYKKVKLYLGSARRSLPTPSPKKELKSITFLKPQIKGIELHKFPSEHVIVVEGDNLWFCDQIILGEGRNVIKIANPVESVSRHVIQFNYSQTKQTDQVITSNWMIKVTLNSHFAKPIRKKVKVEQKLHEFSKRQIQLASYTLTEVICLAYWSAVLEQHHETGDVKDQFQQSQRLKKVREFLEEAVKVVPLESILSAIAFAEDKTAIKCAEALVESKVSVPPSVEALSGMQLGAVRLRTGLHGLGIIQVRDSLVKTLCAKSGFMFNNLKCLSLSASTSNEIKFTLTGLAPVITQVSGKANVGSYNPSSVPVLQSVFEATATTNFESITKAVQNDRLADTLSMYSEQMDRSKGIITDYLCNMNIECIYPMNRTHARHSLYSTPLQSPLDMLHSARMQIALCLEELHDDLDANPDDHIPTNERMLNVLKDIDENGLKVCAALLGSFMEQKVSIPLIKSEIDTANILAERSSPVAVGAWVLFSLGYPELHAKLSSLRGHPLIVEIADYIYGVVSNKLDKPSKKTSQYDAKLQFLLQGVSRIVSCSSRYISYSLERQLYKNLKFDKYISVKELVSKWDRIFKGDALSLVAKSYRSLIARWLKWAVLIYDLREALAEYTCVGVTGLMNSGKSQLVSKLFGIQTVVGTTKRRRTTVPLLYNLDGKVDGLDVMDFPGCDDQEFSIPKLASLLLGLLQVVIFVVHHDRATSAASLEWLKFLKMKDIPVVVCITHGDLLYFEEEDRRKTEKMQRRNDEIREDVRREIGSEIYDKRKELRKLTGSELESLNLYCFNLPSVYSNRAEDLRDAGILEVKDVGNELAKILNQYSSNLSDRLVGFVLKGDQFAKLPSCEKDGHSRPVSKYASILKQIPFIRQPAVFECDSSGGTYTDDSNGISVTIPKNAIPEGQVIHFEVAVTLYGPFIFGSGKRPISPILWICTQEEVSFRKLIEVKLPHFLTGLIESEATQYSVGFAKAAHPKSLKAVQSFEFKPCHTKQRIVVDEDASYATLQTDHCCFLCIEARHSRDLALRAGYCLSRVEYRLSQSRYAIHFCATFQLSSCLEAVKQQYSDKEANIIYSEFKFKDSDDLDAEPVIKLVHASDLDTCQIALEPRKGQIQASTIDFWTKDYDIEGLKLKHQYLLYPPRIKMTVVLKVCDMILPISFQGCSDESDLDVELSISGIPSEIHVPSSLEFESTTNTSSYEHTELSEENLFEVTNYLDPMNKKDIRLGNALGLLYSSLIKMDNLPDDMVYAWLLKKDNVSKNGAPTWSNLVTRLKLIHQTGIAEQIEQDKCKGK